MKKSLGSKLILLGYSIILVKVMVFKDIPIIRVGALRLNFGGADAGGSANLIPFKTILSYFMGNNGLLIGGINLIGNIVLLIPVGIFAPFAFREMTWKKIILFAIAVGCAIEGLQEVLKVGRVDIDDVILNAFGVMIGYIIVHYFKQNKI